MARTSLTRLLHSYTPLLTLTNILCLVQNELVELEARIKNEGDVATMIEKDLSIEEGHLRLYVTYPDGKIKVHKTCCLSINPVFLNRFYLL